MKPKRENKPRNAVLAIAFVITVVGIESVEAPSGSGI